MTTTKETFADFLKEITGPDSPIPGSTIKPIVERIFLEFISTFEIDRDFEEILPDILRRMSSDIRLEVKKCTSEQPFQTFLRERFLQTAGGIPFSSLQRLKEDRASFGYYLAPIILEMYYREVTRITATQVACQGPAFSREKVANELSRGFRRIVVKLLRHVYTKNVLLIIKSEEVPIE